jgi:hypothetical protein
MLKIIPSLVAFAAAQLAIDYLKSDLPDPAYFQARLRLQLKYDAEVGQRYDWQRSRWPDCSEHNPSQTSTETSGRHDANPSLSSSPLLVGPGVAGEEPQRSQGLPVTEDQLVCHPESSGEEAVLSR